MPKKPQILQETVLIRRFENRLAREIEEIIESSRGEILAALYRYDPTAQKGDTEGRIQRIVDKTKALLKEKYSEIRKKLIGDLAEFGVIVNENEADYLIGLLDKNANTKNAK